MVGVGLKSWVKFGVAVTGKSNINKIKFIIIVCPVFAKSGPASDIEKLKYNQRRREQEGSRLEDRVFRQFLCDGNLRLEREEKWREMKSKAKDDFCSYGHYYMKPAKWILESRKKSKLNNQQQEEEKILKSQRDLILARQSVGCLTSTQAFLKFCKGTNRLREAEFLKKFT